MAPQEQAAKVRGHSDLDSFGPGLISSASGLHVAVFARYTRVLPLKEGRASFSLFPRAACWLGLLSQDGLSLLDACLFREMRGWMDRAVMFASQVLFKAV